jgi:flagellar biosynthesis/type III secretory pathway chaperone
MLSVKRSQKALHLLNFDFLLKVLSKEQSQISQDKLTKGKLNSILAQTQSFFNEIQMHTFRL